MSFIYLASPYSHYNIDVMQKRYEDAVTATVKLLKANITVFSPIVHFHPLALLHDLPKDADFWLQHNLPFLKASCGLYVLMLPGWQESKGVAKEIKIATSLKLEVLYVAEDFYA